MDDDQLELARRRLEDEVKSNVEGGLFRYYRNVGSIIIAVLGAFGFAIGWPALREMIEDEISEQIAVQVTQPVDDAKAATAAAETAAQRAEEIANATLGRLEERQLQLREDIGSINARYDEVSINYGSAKTRLSAINEQITQLEEAIAYFKELAKRDPVGRVELDGLKASIAEIATKSSALASIVGQTSTVTPTDVPMVTSNVETLQQELAQVATEQTNALEATDKATIANPKGNSTVFVQFAGGSREDIRAVTGLLRENGWTVPGEERLESAAGKHEIRYFHDVDRKAAEVLREEINAALVSAGFPDTQIGEIDSPFRVSNLPAKGILEVWLEIPVK